METQIKNFTNMKKILFVFLIPIISFANPNWLYNIAQNDKNEIIGYGIDADLSKAKQNAISDITNTLYVSVKSSMSIEESDKNGNYNRNSSMALKTESQAVLSGVVFIKTAQENNLWYVAAKYDNSALKVKLKKLLPSILKDESQNKYLKNTPLIKNLNSYIKAKLNYKIVRKDNLWQLEYNDILLPLNERNFYKLFSNQECSVFSIKANKSIYQENDEIYFNITNHISGFFSILYVEHNGKVGVLLENQHAEKSFRYPEATSGEKFKIANPYNKPIQELYIAIFSKEPINILDFEAVSDNLLDESNYNFDKLISKLNDLEYSTFMIKIRK